jgi:hypothetical protein
MTKWFSGALAAALMISFGCVPTLTHAEEGATAESTEAGTTDSTGDKSQEDETFMEKLENDLKETPTDESENPIAADEDTDRDLF